MIYKTVIIFCMFFTIYIKSMQSNNRLIIDKIVLIIIEREKAFQRLNSAMREEQVTIEQVRKNYSNAVTLKHRLILEPLSLARFREYQKIDAAYFQAQREYPLPTGFFEDILDKE